MTRVGVDDEKGNGVRITKEVVTRAAGWASEVTNGTFTLSGIGGDIGHGVRYFDGITQTTWLGRYGAREAAGYYLGAGVEWAHKAGVEVPEWQRETLDYLAGGGQPRSVREAVARGIQDAAWRYASRLRRA